MGKGKGGEGGWKIQRGEATSRGWSIWVPEPGRLEVGLPQCWSCCVRAQRTGTGAWPAQLMEVAQARGGGWGVEQGGLRVQTPTPAAV